MAMSMFPEKGNGFLIVDGVLSSPQPAAVMEDYKACIEGGGAREILMPHQYAIDTSQAAR